MKLKELAELLGVKLLKKVKVCIICDERKQEIVNGKSNQEIACGICWDCNKISNNQERDRTIEEYDNLEIPIEKLMPSVGDIEKCLKTATLKWNKNPSDLCNILLYYAQAIHNLKPGGK